MPKEELLQQQIDEMKKEIGLLRTIKDNYKKFLKEIKEEIWMNPVDIDYLKTIFAETYADCDSFVREDWEEE